MNNNKREVKKMKKDLEMQEFVEFLETTKAMIDRGCKGSSTITKTQGRGNTYTLTLTYCYETPSSKAKYIPGDWTIKCSTIEKAKLKQNLFNQQLVEAQ
jgi:invasion protein IalB